jgi:hypothetical protein
MALLQGEQVPSLVVRRTVDPTAMQDADPLEGEGAQGGLVVTAPRS